MLELRPAVTANQIGDVIADNAHDDIAYRFHDVIHLAYAAVLGWSPVFRSLIAAKRNDDDDCDRVEDGARAICDRGRAWSRSFNSAQDRDFRFDGEQLDWELVKHLRRTMRGLEVEALPAISWGRAYEVALSTFLALSEAGLGSSRSTSTSGR